MNRSTQGPKILILKQLKLMGLKALMMIDYIALPNMSKTSFSVTI